MDLEARLPLNSSTSRSDMELSFYGSRTIFEEADYFARNHLYKLMPITSETVNETIIHMEHDYCNFGLFPGENLNKAMHVEAEERNYKKRKSKSASGGFSGPDNKINEKESLAASAKVREEFFTNSKSDEDHSVPIQPLDLSLPVLHDQKTEKLLKENQSNILKTKVDSRTSTDVIPFNVCESNKENVTSARKIQVTISRPGQKEYYEPCEVFLNDLARISPDLIKNDCYEIEIIDRTGKDWNKEKTRLYYIVSESTWQTFENSSERIILTNDLNIGEPIPDNDNFNKPTYVIFDRYSLTESLVKMCEKNGGRFEYTCLEESIPKMQETRREVQDCAHEFPAISRNVLEEEKRKNCEEKKTDLDKRHKTETNILKRLLLCEDRNIKIESDSNIIPETMDESKVTRIETEEKIFDNSGFISTGAIIEESKTTLMLTEPKVPSVFNPNHVKGGSYKTDEEIHFLKMETENSKFEKILKLKIDDKEREDNGALMKETKRKNESQENKVIVSDTTIRTEKNSERFSCGFENYDVKKKKRENVRINEEEKQLSNHQVDVNSPSKRITRSAISIVNEGSNAKNLIAKSGKGRNKTGKVQASKNGKESVKREKRVSRKGKKLLASKCKAREEDRRKICLKKSSSVKEIIESGKATKRRSTEEFLQKFRNKGDCFERRETRSTEKKRFTENMRRTRMRTQEHSKVNVSSTNVNKSCTKKR